MFYFFSLDFFRYERVYKWTSPCCGGGTYGENTHDVKLFPFSAQKYLDSSGRKTERELVEEREQRMKENDTKMMQIKEKEEELKRIEEKFLMALSTAIDKWVEHANDEGWLASYFDVHLFSFIIIIYSVSILLSSVSEADVRGFWSR